MLKPGSEAFNNALLNATTNPISEGGAAIIDQSKANSVEFNYNLGDLVPTFDLSIGGSYRDYTFSDQMVPYLQIMILLSNLMKSHFILRLKNYLKEL